MHFEKGQLYHIYNQGNNRQKIFFERENYLFFLRKMRVHLMPYCDILAYCLMPNHFHFMVMVNELDAVVITDSVNVKDTTKGFAQSETLGNGKPRTLNQSIGKSSDEVDTRGATSLEFRANHSSDDLKSSDEFAKQRSLNQSIAIMLRSYTRAINKQQGTTGSLFRPKTKAECLTETNGITPSFYNAKYDTIIRIDNPEDQYPQVCFSYIHQNPLRAGLVKIACDWEFSSAQDYAEIRKGTLVNKKVAKEYIMSP